MHFFELITYLPFIAAGTLGFGFLVGFHELGHFLFCKLFGVRTPSFSIGFGPKLLKKQIGDTLFSISALPFGGYVEIAGADEPGQGEQKESKSTAADSLAVKPYYQKMLIIAGGIIFNIIFAYAAVTAACMLGVPETQLLFPHNATSKISKVIQDSPAAKAGLQEGDTIEAIRAGDQEYELSRMPVADFMQNLLLTLGKNANKEVTLRITRSGQEQDSGAYAVNVTPATTGLGITFSFLPVKAQGFMQALRMGAKQINFWISSAVDALTKLFRERTMKGIGGPVMVISAMIKNAEQGFTLFLLFLAFISVNLAVMNLIPLPVFDGGQALFYTIEAIIGKPLYDSLRTAITYATWLVLLALISFITLQDILILVKPYFG